MLPAEYTVTYPWRSSGLLFQVCTAGALPSSASSCSCSMGGLIGCAAANSLIAGWEKQHAVLL